MSNVRVFNHKTTLSYKISPHETEGKRGTVVWVKQLWVQRGKVTSHDVRETAVRVGLVWGPSQGGTSWIRRSNGP